MKLFVVRADIQQKNSAASFHSFHVEAKVSDNLTFFHALTD